MSIVGWLEAGFVVWLAITFARFQLMLRKISRRDWKSLGNGFILTVVFWPFAVWNVARE